MHLLFYSLFFLTFCFTSQAQILELGGGLQALGFRGDVASSAWKANVNSGTELFLRYTSPKRIEFIASYFSGKISADDFNATLEEERNRNLSFFSRLQEFRLQTVYNIGNPVRKKGAFACVPYLGTGIGYTFFNPHAYYQNQQIALQEIGTEGQGIDGFSAPYKRTTFVVPINGGFKFILGAKLNLSFDFSYRISFTDYMDDVSGVYVSKTRLEGQHPLAVELADRSAEIAYTRINRPGDRRGNSNNNDAYWTFGVRLGFVVYKHKTKEGLRLPKKKIYKGWF